MREADWVAAFFGVRAGSWAGEQQTYGLDGLGRSYAGRSMRNDMRLAGLLDDLDG